MAVERGKPSTVQSGGPGIWSFLRGERKVAPGQGSLWPHRQRLMARLVVREGQGRGPLGERRVNGPGERLQGSPCHTRTPRPPRDPVPVEPPLCQTSAALTQALLHRIANRSSDKCQRKSSALPPLPMLLPQNVT